MLKPEQVPPDAMYAAWKAINAGMTLNDAIAAAINAWPGVTTRTGLYTDLINAAQRSASPRAACGRYVGNVEAVE